ncbi:hypothetical protein [Candidatus Manganitrophus noduliformans]|uniref:Uncharacterized protein n=1 Tax=Candidatus Manganitrophus noduliformans TaxID=2606439 RepID=A0A7X6DSB0_9BACT|nr:hypothetical protein [Candidatus Manganitrophus noduliformans]NKE72470.1 hypothetical protein [Candidatus Manganitrophus noduliformans]
MNIIKKVSAALPLLLAGMLTVAGTEAQAVDFNINTQLTDLRSDGSNNNPGFNPCRGGTRSAAGVCGGALVLDASALALLDPDNLQTVFPSLGPGAVTDNMFGIISGQDASGTPIPVTACGEVTNASLAGLNCGDLRFNPSTQGQTTLTTDANTLVTPVAGLDMNSQFVADFCPGPAGAPTDCSDGGGTPAQVIAAHTGFNVTNDFNFIRLTGTTSEITGSQSMRQVTAVKTANIGTQAAPGTGDQLVEISADWATTAANPSSNNPATNPNSLTVTWTQNISDPDQSGTGASSFTQNIAGSFVYNGTADAVSAQYPSGRTQTERSIGVAAPVGESMVFDAVP